MPPTPTDDAADGLTLYTDRFWISPYVFTCYVALRAKGLRFATSPVALDRGEQHDGPFAARSITARVPALVHGDFALSESSAIVEYLDEAFPHAPPLLPAELRARARARQVLAWIRSDLGALRDERPTHTMFYARATTPLSTAGRAAADKLVRVAAALIPATAGPLFGAWSIADADLAFMLHRLILDGEAVPDHVRAFAQTEWARTPTSEFVARARPPYVPY